MNASNFNQYSCLHIPHNPTLLMITLLTYILFPQNWYVVQFHCDQEYATVPRSSFKKADAKNFDGQQEIGQLSEVKIKSKWYRVTIKRGYGNY